MIVTEAASGIGGETAIRFAEEGAVVVCADLDGAANRAVADEISGQGGTAFSVQADVTDSGDVARLIEDSVAACGNIDVLVNNPGVTILGGVAELSEAAWQREINTNLSSVYRTSKAIWPHLVATGGGAILSTASIAGILAAPQDAAYVASKAGLIMLTRSMALRRRTRQDPRQLHLPGLRRHADVRRFPCRSTRSRGRPRQSHRPHTARPHRHAARYRQRFRLPRFR